MHGAVLYIIIVYIQIYILATKNISLLIVVQLWIRMHLRVVALRNRRTVGKAFFKVKRMRIFLAVIVSRSRTQLKIVVPDIAVWPPPRDGGENDMSNGTISVTSLMARDETTMRDKSYRKSDWIDHGDDKGLPRHYCIILHPF